MLVLLLLLVLVRGIEGVKWSPCVIFTCSKLLNCHSWLKHDRFLACETGDSACETGYGDMI